MDITMRVNRVSTHSAEVAVTHKGEHAMAMMPELQVELHDDEGGHGSFTLHFLQQSEIAEANSVFVSGDQVTFTATRKAGEAAAAEEPPAA
jgi:hypothetical protein